MERLVKKGSEHLAQARDEKMLEQTNAPIQLDTAVRIKMPRANVKEVDEKYKCSCCGASWKTAKGHFSKSASPLYQCNDGYINICNDCRDKYYYQLVELYDGNEAHAIRHICQQFDIIFNLDALTASRQISADRSRISHYLAKKNLGQTTRIGSTYIDGMKYDFDHNTYLQTELEISPVIKKNSNPSATINTLSDPEEVLISSEEWRGLYTQDDLDYLNNYYSSLERDYNIVTENHRDYARKIAKASLAMDKAFNEMTNGIPGADIKYKNMKEAFDSLSKSAKFSESTRSVNDVGASSFSKVAAMVESHNWIPQHKPMEKDAIDEMLDYLSTITKSV